MPQVNLTSGRIVSFSCAIGQAFLWDTIAPGLAVRATAGGKKTFIVQGRLAGKTVRVKIGAIGSVTIDDARGEARRILLLISQGIDPREQKRQIIAEQKAAVEVREQEEAINRIKAAILSDAWQVYLDERKERWGELHYRDHIELSRPPGQPRNNGKGTLKTGPLHSLLAIQFSELTAATIERWLAKHAAIHPARASLALRLFKAFLAWCGEHEAYKTAIEPDLITRRAMEILPKKKAKKDCLQREQLAAWFQAVRQVNTPVIAAYLQTLLLTGARREELAALKWVGVDFKWRTMTIRDKEESKGRGEEGGDTRTIPLTPYVAALLTTLPRRNQWVFSSSIAASGHIENATKAHYRALKIAGIEGLTLHGLRRSFSTLAGDDSPAGVVAQIMGHKPSATAERHYKVRSLSDLRKWHTMIEARFIEQAGLSIPVEQPTPLRLVAIGGKK